jgi:VCBS repeat-containing protein
MVKIVHRGGNHKLKLTGDFQGVLAEDTHLSDHGTVKVKGAKGKLKATDSFLATDHDSGSPLGTFSATGSKNITWTYSLDNEDARVQALADGETVHETHRIKVKNGTQTVTKLVTVTIAGTNDAPVVTSSDVASIAENTSAVLTVSATDVDHNATQVFSIEGGADASLFQIDENTGALSFISPPDFEANGSAGADNAYHVTVGVSDGHVTTTQDITVNVTNVAEGPVISSDGGDATASVDIDENGAAVTTVSAAPGTITYSISGGDDASLFQIDENTGALSFVSAPDFEAPADVGGDNGYEVEVQASDGSLTDVQSITVHVHNTNEAPVALNLSAESIDENNAPGAVVATLSALDPDALSFDPDIAASFFDNSYLLDSVTVSCVGSLADCDIGNQPDSPVNPSPDATALYNFVRDHADIFLDGGSLPSTSYTQSVTLTGFSGVGNFTFTYTYDITPNVPSVPAATAWEPAIDDGGFAGPFTFELVAGSGDDDNAVFTVDGDQLKLNGAANFEAKDSYSIHLKVTDAGGLSHEVTKVITVNNVNEAPIGIGAISIDENNAPGAVVATLSALDQDALSFDPDIAASFFDNSYLLDSVTVSCVGAPVFCDVGNQPDSPVNPSPDTTALLNFVLDNADTFFNGGALSGTSYTQSVTLPGINSLGLFTFTYTYEITPNVPSVPAATAWEPAIDDGGFAGPFTFELVAGTGDDDNAVFTIDGDQLKLNEAANFEAKDSYSIHLKVTDAGGLSHEVTKVITVNNVNEAPVALNLSAESIDENNAPGAVVATLSAVDQDALSFDPDIAVSFFDNSYLLDSVTVSCVGSPIDCSIGNQPNPASPSPDATALSNFVLDNADTFFNGGALSSTSYTQSVTLPGNNSLALFTFTFTYEITPTVPFVAPLTAWQPAVDDGGFAAPFIFELVAGSGDDDNSAFSIAGDQLKLDESADFETKDHYSIHLKVTDAGGQSHETTQVIEVHDNPLA